MPRLAAKIASALALVALVAASAGVTATVILWPHGVVEVAGAL